MSIDSFYMFNFFNSGYKMEQKFIPDACKCEVMKNKHAFEPVIVEKELSVVSQLRYDLRGDSVQ